MWRRGEKNQSRDKRSAALIFIHALRENLKSEELQYKAVYSYWYLLSWTRFEKHSLVV